MPPHCRDFCIHCLVSVFIFKFMCYIVRQRHFSEFIQNLLKYSLILKLNKSVTVIYNVQNLCFKLTVAKTNLAPGLAFLPGFKITSQVSSVCLCKSKNSIAPPVPLLLTVQTRREYLCIIQYKCITLI